MDRRTSSRLAPFLLLVLPLAAGCGPQQSQPPMNPIFLVDFARLADTANLDAEMGLGRADGPTVELTGELAPGGEIDLTCGPAAAGPHPAFRLRLSGEGAELTLTAHRAGTGRDHDGQEADVRLVRLEGGEVVVSTGRGSLDLHRATRRAGARSVSGTFEAELEGEAGSGTVSGRFESCYYFS